jgi:hypothetical protein
MRTPPKMTRKTCRKVDWKSGISIPNAFRPPPMMPATTHAMPMVKIEVVIISRPLGE